MKSILDLRYVQTDLADGLAYIDSRVYCAEIIEVNHRDWFRDTLLKYKDLIEARFGHIRIETDVVNRPQGGGNGIQYALLTEPQSNALLVFSRNTAKVTEKKLDLIAEFEKCKLHRNENLERQLLASIGASIADNTRYNITVYAVWRDSGIRNPSYVKDVILTHYDYRIVNQFICVTQQTYEDLIENFRAMDGAVVDKLPAEKRRKFRHSDYSKMNRREPQKRDENYGILDLQLSLFDA